MTIRTYRRRSKNEGKQQFSLDVQSAGCEELIARLGLADQPRTGYVDDERAGDDFLTRNGLHQLLPDAQRGDVIVCRDEPAEPALSNPLRDPNGMLHQNSSIVETGRLDVQAVGASISGSLAVTSSKATLSGAFGTEICR
jgi:hypothetical protein